MKNCRKCGSLIEEDDIYCPRCGCKNIDEDESVQNKVNLEKNSSNEPVSQNITENQTNQINNPSVISDTWNTSNTSNTSYGAYPPVSMERKKEISPLCIIGFILTFFGGSIISLILCIIGVANFDETKQTGKGFGIAGIVINSVLIAITIITVIAIICIGGSLMDEFYHEMPQMFFQ